MAGNGEHWGQQVQGLAARAGEMYARSLRRYNELLERVARGELRPEQVQQWLREYFQRQGAASTRDMAASSVSLLAGLLHLEARYRDAMLDGLLPADAPAAAPPVPTGDDVTAWFQALATYAAEQNARTAARQQQLIDRLSSGNIPAAVVHEHGRRFLEAHASHFLGDVMGLGLTFIEQLQQSSAAVTDGLYDGILGPDSPAVATDADPIEPPIYVELRGAPASVATARIEVENTRQTAAEVMCRASAFVSRTGGPPIAPRVTIAPSQFTLAPAERREVGIRVLLDPGQFLTDTDYLATLVVSGAGTHELVVHLLARADAEPHGGRVSSPARPSSSATGPSASVARRTRSTGTRRTRASAAARRKG